MATAINDSIQAATATCPAPADVDSEQLYGRWQAQFDAGPGASPTQASLQLARNPQFGGSLSGTITRDAATAQVAGDVDNGVFTLEESVDGRAITATWTGRIVDGSCGREIQGTWKNVADQSTHDFVLRRPPGRH